MLSTDACLPPVNLQLLFCLLFISVPFDTEVLVLELLLFFLGGGAGGWGGGSVSLTAAAAYAIASLNPAKLIIAGLHILSSGMGNPGRVKRRQIHLTFRIDSICLGWNCLSLADNNLVRRWGNCS